MFRPLPSKSCPRSHPFLSSLQQLTIEVIMFNSPRSSTPSPSKRSRDRRVSNHSLPSSPRTPRTPTSVCFLKPTKKRSLLPLTNGLVERSPRRDNFAHPYKRPPRVQPPNWDMPQDTPKRSGMTNFMSCKIPVPMLRIPGVPERPIDLTLNEGLKVSYICS
jgi:hypothetical protein